MTTKYIQEGKKLTLVAPEGGVTVNVPVAIGSLVVLPETTAAAEATFVGIVQGVISCTKVGSQAWTAGQMVYWDAGDSRFTSTAADGVPAGYAVEAVASGAGDTTGKVLLTPCSEAGQAAGVAALAGTLTGTTDGTLADVAAVSTAGGNTYADSAINTAITSVNLQLKELQTTINAILTSLKAAGVMGPAA